MDENGTKLYEARTDGHLFQTLNAPSKVIVEVKPGVRGNCPRVRLQETAQMVAWIHKEPHCEGQMKPNSATSHHDGDNAVGQVYRRLLISQNRHEIYLIVAEYDGEYYDYITNSKREEPCTSFIWMREFGPWNINNPDDVQNIASIILAVTLQFSKDEDQGLGLNLPS
ncbi:hypothetical protein BJX61DRAFT_541775 [Aspergillus egyptiacus]|nr:hypothetical protein BJX61DRAFT_541775 [Aspergillus egyptiacus]